MEGKVGEDPRFRFVPSHVLEIARKEEHAQYFKDVGLSGFVSEVPWENQHHSTAEMLELIQNFDKNLAKSRVNGTTVSLSAESLKTMFRLEAEGQVDEKIANYSPKSFSCSDRGKSNGAYVLQNCRNDVVKERLEFQLVTLHMKGTRVETVALYQIQQVEEALRADWGKCFISRLVEKIGKAKEILLQKKGRATCAFASHLQVILSLAISPSPSVRLSLPGTMQPTIGQPIHIEQGIEAMLFKNCREVVDAPQGDNVWTATVHPISEQPIHMEQTRQGASCSRQCKEIAEELKRDYLVMAEGQRKMTTMVGEVSKELGTLKALCKNLVKELYESRINHLPKGKVDTMQASGPKGFDSTILALTEDNTLEGRIHFSSVEDNIVHTSPLCMFKDNEDDCNGNSAKSFGKKATDIQVHEVIMPSLSLEDNGAQWNGKVPNSKEDCTIGDKGGIPCVTTKARPTQPVKCTKLQQQKLLLPRVNVAMHKPQLVKRKLDMNTKVDSKSSQGGNHRQPRRMWSKEETDYLVSAVQRYGERWSIIARGGIGILVDRKQGDCKDRWRNVNKEGD